MSLDSEDPVTLAVVGGLSTSAGGTAYGVYQAEKGGREEKRAAYRQAQQVRTAGEQQAKVKREQAARLAGSQRAAFGAAGLEGVGMPAIVTLDSLLAGLRDSNRILTGATKQESNIKKAGRRARAAGTRKGIGVGIAGIGELLKIGMAGLEGE